MRMPTNDPTHEGAARDLDAQPRDHARSRHVLVWQQVARPRGSRWPSIVGGPYMEAVVLIGSTEDLVRGQLSVLAAIASDLDSCVQRSVRSGSGHGLSWWHLVGSWRGHRILCHTDSYTVGPMGLARPRMAAGHGLHTDISALLPHETLLDVWLPLLCRAT